MAIQSHNEGPSCQIPSTRRLGLIWSTQLRHPCFEVLKRLLLIATMLCLSDLFVKVLGTVCVLLMSYSLPCNEAMFCLVSDIRATDI